jgi:LuxR family transcriptional regulator, maltose regulon positive regulatory protein
MVSMQTVQQGALKRRRIIERPRLIALLDESKARVRLLVASAGYGKTTLADQWIARDGRTGAWFRARRSSTDVAALALDLARVAAGVVPGCDERLREHLRALPAPAENPDVLAEILGEDLETWPASAWLVIDEYQEIAYSNAAEGFVEALIAASPIQLLIASRVRPAWVRERTILYGDVSEISQADLAMDDEEAADVLANRGASTSRLLALARGWPAVLGLASVSTAEVHEAYEVPESLYRFFAEEVFGAFEASVQQGLVTLSIAPILDRQLATELLGAETAEAVCRATLDAGITVERGAHLELHPLARSFLEGRAAHVGVRPTAQVAGSCAAHYRERRDWDAAFDVISRHGPRDQLVPLMLEALDELLDTARLPTIETWCALADRQDAEAPCFPLARAEVALRRGRFTEAQTHAEAAAALDSTLTYRALSTAGRAAHLASREHEALDLYRRAEAASTTLMDRREATWYQVICLVDLELPEAAQILEALRSTLIRSDPNDVVRSAGIGLAYQFKLGRLDLVEADRARELLDAVKDPIARTSFMSIYGSGLCAAARYDEALEIAEALIALASALRLDFALPYAQASAATAQAGRRNWRRALVHIEEAVATARAGQNDYAEHVTLAAKIRILAQRGMHETALALGLPNRPSSVPSAEAEVVGSRALALASSARVHEAERLVDEVRGLSHAIEPVVLISAVDAIVALKSGSRDVSERVTEFYETAVNVGASDLLVTAYRSTPELLRLLLLDGAKHRDELARLVARIGDGDLAEAVGQPLSLGDPSLRLTRREHEVFALMQDGLTNRQIAATLFIAESTAKLHAQRVYDKLGVHSRRDIAFQARLHRRDQATSAIEGTDGSGGASLL